MIDGGDATFVMQLVHAGLFPPARVRIEASGQSVVRVFRRIIETFSGMNKEIRT
jgi:hypothetical protein